MSPSTKHSKTYRRSEMAHVYRGDFSNSHTPWHVSLPLSLTKNRRLAAAAVEM